MDDFTIEAFTLLGIGLGVIFLRTASRLSTVGIKRFQADDYLMLVAALAYAIETALAYSVGAYWRGLANNGMTDEERAALDPNSEEFRLRVNGSKTQVAGWSTYTFLLWVLKAAMCTFYLRLCEGLPQFTMRINIGFVLIFTTWLAVLFSILFGCFPLEKNWQIYPDPGNFCQPAISKIDIFVTVVLNVLTDLYLLSIPVPMLWQSRLPPLKKFGLIVLFSGGLFVTMAGILRCVLILTNPITGAQQAGSWAVRETFVAVVTTNLPMIFPLLRRWLGPVGTTISKTWSKHTHGSKMSNYRDGGAGSGAYKLEDTSATASSASGGRKKNRGAPYTQYPITNVTVNESEEHINSGVGVAVSGGIRKEIEFHVTASQVKRDLTDEESSIEGPSRKYTGPAGKKSMDGKRDRESGFFGHH